MSRNKYVKDYRLEPSVTEKGKIKTKVRYVGGEFDFDRDRETVARSGRVLLYSSVLGWIAFIAALIPKTSVMRTLFFSLPAETVPCEKKDPCQKGTKKEAHPPALWPAAACCRLRRFPLHAVLVSHIHAASCRPRITGIPIVKYRCFVLW